MSWIILVFWLNTYKYEQCSVYYLTYNLALLSASLVLGLKVQTTTVQSFIVVLINVFMYFWIMLTGVKDNFTF